MEECSPFVTLGRWQLGAMALLLAWYSVCALIYKHLDVQVRSALAEGRSVHLYALETRPYNQGSRLTTWECSREGIPCTLLADSMAGALLASGRVSTVVAGADRFTLQPPLPSGWQIMATQQTR